MQLPAAALLSCGADDSTLSKIADSENNGYLDFAAFQRFVKLMKRRADVETLFKELTSGRDELDGDEWIRFLKDTQKVSLRHIEVGPPLTRVAIVHAGRSDLAGNLPQICGRNELQDDYRRVCNILAVHR